ERANQVDRRNRLDAGQLARLQLRLQHLAFSVDHVEILDLAFLILRRRQMRRTLRRIDRIVLLLDLIVEQTQVGQVVLDFAERLQHLLTILRDVFVVLPARLIDTGAATAAVEEWHGQRSARERPEQERAARPVEQVGQRARFETARRRDVELREI